MYIINEPMDMIECAHLLNGAVDWDYYDPLNATLKRKITQQSLFYGLFLKKQMIAYLWLMRWNSGYMYRVHETTVATEYQRQGLATFLYTYPVLNDFIHITSDRSHTAESYFLWKKLGHEQGIRLRAYNSITNEVTDEVDDESQYGNDFMHLIITK